MVFPLFTEVFSANVLLHITLSPTKVSRYCICTSGNIICTIYPEDDGCWVRASGTAPHERSAWDSDVELTRFVAIELREPVHVLSVQGSQSIGLRAVCAVCVCKRLYNTMYERERERERETNLACSTTNCMSLLRMS